MSNGLGSKILICVPPNSKALTLFELPDFLAVNHGHDNSKSLIHVFSVVRQEADLLVPLEHCKFPIDKQRFKVIIER